MAENIARYTLERKHDVWSIPAETRVLEIKCGIGMHTAREIVERCRELEKVLFDGGAYTLTAPEAVEYLRQNAFVIIESGVHHHGVDEEKVKEIHLDYAMGHHTIESLAEKHGLDEKKIWHVLHNKVESPKITVIKKSIKKKKSSAKGR
jgi:hypothetical protein